MSKINTHHNNSNNVKANVAEILRQMANSPVNENCPLHGINSIRDASINKSPLATFLCSAISDPRLQPGKIGYMSCELFGGEEVWDAYSNDAFSLGAILHCMLTGRPPFVHPHINDPWFKAISSGNWLHMLHQQQLKHGIQSVQPPNGQPSECNSFVQVFSHLSPSALHLLDQVLKPQNKRYTLRQILNHPWLSDSTKRHRTHTKVAQVDQSEVIALATPLISNAALAAQAQAIGKSIVTQQQQQQHFFHTEENMQTQPAS